MTEDQTLQSSNVLVAGAGVVKAALDYYSAVSASGRPVICGALDQYSVRSNEMSTAATAPPSPRFVAIKSLLLGEEEEEEELSCFL